MKPEDLQKNIVEASNLALKEGMGTDEIVDILIYNAVSAADQLGLSKQFCEDQFIDAVDDIYGEEEEDEECPADCMFHGSAKCCKEKQTQQACPDMKLFFHNLLKLKEDVLKDSKISGNACYGIKIINTTKA